MAKTKILSKEVVADFNDNGFVVVKNFEKLDDLRRLTCQYYKVVNGEFGDQEWEGPKKVGEQKQVPIMEETVPHHAHRINACLAAEQLSG